MSGARGEGGANGGGGDRRNGAGAPVTPNTTNPLYRHRKPDPWHCQNFLSTRDLRHNKKSVHDRHHTTLATYARHRTNTARPPHAPAVTIAVRSDGHDQHLPYDGASLRQTPDLRVFGRPPLVPRGRWQGSPCRAVPLRYRWFPDPRPPAWGRPPKQGRGWSQGRPSPPPPAHRGASSRRAPALPTLVAPSTIIRRVIRPPPRPSGSAHSAIAPAHRMVTGRCPAPALLLPRPRLPRHSSSSAVARTTESLTGQGASGAREASSAGPLPFRRMRAAQPLHIPPIHWPPVHSPAMRPQPCGSWSPYQPPSLLKTQRQWGGGGGRQMATQAWATGGASKSPPPSHPRPPFPLCAPPMPLGPAFHVPHAGLALTATGLKDRYAKHRPAPAWEERRGAGAALVSGRTPAPLSRTKNIGTSDGDDVF